MTDTGSEAETTSNAFSGYATPTSSGHYMFGDSATYSTNTLEQAVTVAEN